nr:G protein-coupled receptor [Proales similis]
MLELKRPLFNILLLLIGKCSSETLCESKWSVNQISCEIEIDCIQVSSSRPPERVDPIANLSTKCCDATLQIELSLKINYNSQMGVSTDQNAPGFLPEQLKSLARCSSGGQNPMKIKLSYFDFTKIDFNFAAMGLDHTKVDHFFEFGHIRLSLKSPVNNCSSPNTMFKGNGSLEANVYFRRGVIYHSNICDTMFKAPGFESIAVSLVKHSSPSFKQTSMRPRDLNSHVKILDIEGYGFNLDEKLFPSSIFAHTYLLDVRGALKDFSSEVLIGKRLQRIEMQLLRLNRFWHNNIAWLDHVNERVNKSVPLVIFFAEPRLPPKDKVEIWVALFYYRMAKQFETIYDVEPRETDLFTAENFCIFYRLERKRLNVRFTGLLFEEKSQNECGCVLFWIVEKYFMSKNINPSYYETMGECEKRRDQLSRDCDFALMAARCELKPIRPVEEPSAYSVIFSLKLAEYWTSILIAPILSLLGVLFNTVIIYVFRSMKKSSEYRINKIKDKGRRMWDYLYLNSFFVLLQAAVFTLGPVTSCIEYGGIYCSPWILSRFSQLFYLLVESYAGNVLRLMANISNSMFVLYRFALNRDCWPRLRAWQPARIMKYAIIPCLLISLIKLWLNERFSIDILDQDIRQYRSDRNLDAFNRNRLLKGVYLINMLLTNIVFVLLNFSVDCLLLFHLRSHQAKNRKEEAESRITKMIILNGVFSLLFRTPEVVSTLALIIFSFDVNTFPTCILAADSIHSVCPILFQISKFFYILSLLEGLILLLVFNKRFKKKMYDFIRPSKVSVQSVQ